MDSYPSRNIVWPRRAVVTAGMPYGCLLYTSDAADD